MRGGERGERLDFLMTLVLSTEFEGSQETVGERSRWTVAAVLVLVCLYYELGVC